MPAQDSEAVLREFGGLLEAPEVAQAEGPSGDGVRLPDGVIETPIAFPGFLKPGLALIDASDRAVARLRSALGEPDARAAVTFLGTDRIEVLRFPAAGQEGEIVRYATLGMSAQPMADPTATLADPDRAADRLSASYLIALAARVVREVGDLLRRSREAGKSLATLSLDTEIRFRSAAERAAFTSDLTGAITTLVARYHDAAAPGGRAHRLVVVAHPLPRKPIPEE